MTLQRWMSEGGAVDQQALDRLARVFDLSKKDAASWKSGGATFEKLLNLSPSEDATITHFLMPLLKHLGYTQREIDVKPLLHINYGRKVVERGGGERCCRP